MNGYKKSKSEKDEWDVVFCDFVISVFRCFDFPLFCFFGFL